MKRRWKIALGLLVVLAVLLGVNAVTTSNQVREAEVTVEGGRILELSRGDVQVTDTGEPPGGVAEQPIVLIHCWTCSLRWFDRLEPLLAERHRVIRIDLLGHGGSEKPGTGYEIPAQAALVAEALSELGVEGALVAGNSMGAMVTASLAEQASQLVDRAVVIGMGPNTEDFGEGVPLTARLVHVPVIGQGLWRVTPDFMVERETGVSFTEGFDRAEGFEDPDTPVDDVRAMTYTAYDASHDAADEFVAEAPLNERFRAAAVPLLVVFGAEDELFDAERAAAGYADVPGVQTAIVKDAGHAPQVEQPEEVARILERFAIALPEADGRPKARRRAGSRERGGEAEREAKGRQGKRARAKGSGDGGKRDRKGRG